MNKDRLKIKGANKIVGPSIGFPGSVCLSADSRNNVELLCIAKMVNLGLSCEESVYIEPICLKPPIKYRQRISPKVSSLRFKSKILIFKNIFNVPDKERNQWFSPGALYLSSSLKRSGFEVILSNLKISLQEEEFITEKESLEKILQENPEINFVGISLCEDFFEKAKELTKFIRMKTRAFIGVGGVMPTLTPEHVFAHMPEINFLVRGAGENLFPKIVKILYGENIDSNLSEKQIRELLKLKGLIFKNNSIFISASLDKIVTLENYDHSLIDFSFLQKEDLTEGLNLFTSRGCFNNCWFCASFGKGEYTGKSFKNLKIILRDYKKRLNEIFGKTIPFHALKLSFNDDDFLADSQRAMSFLSYLYEQPLRLNFFQTGINSFFEKKETRYTNKINQGLINSLSSSIFSVEKSKIYIGTENFQDEELKRLNKGYGFSKIEKVISVLAEKKIYQLHHFIISNQLTTPDNILSNLINIIILKILYGKYFNILVPAIPYLVSFYPSKSYKIILMNKREKYLDIKKMLKIKNYSEYDYPIVKRDIPINKITREMVPRLYKLFLSEKDYQKILDETLLRLLVLKEETSYQKKDLNRIIEKYKDYPKTIFRRIGFKTDNDRNNLQLMVTRRCQLRCRYCPIIKKNADMREDVLYRAIDLLFTSTRNNLRLDFTGGEPLLRFDLIKKGVAYAKMLAKKKNKMISFYLVTNLIALDDDMANLFAKEKFFLELSVDGQEEFHNMYKIAKNPEINPYRSTISRLGKIFSRRIDNYAVMVASPLTVEYLSRNFRHILELGFRNIGINYSIGLLWQENARNKFFQQLGLIKEKFYPFIDKGIIKLSNFGPRIEPAILNSEIMVDVNGNVNFLTDWLFEKENRKKVLPIGRIGSFKKLNHISLTKFLILYRLLWHFRRSSIRKIIINNIEMGNSVKEYIEAWKKK